jgi:S1-C subfamily serine protease
MATSSARVHPFESATKGIMRSARLVIVALAFVGAFYWFTNSRHAPEIVRRAAWVTAPQQVPATQAAGPEQLDSEERNNVDVYRRVVPAVVNITSRAMTFDFFYGAVPQEGQGSGFVIDKEGHILTNYHVVAGGQQLEVTLHDNKRKYREVAVVGTDRAHDLALLQIRGQDLPSVTLGDSGHLLVGQKVYAIGNPFGLAGTMSRGIISSLRPVQTPTGANIDDAIQTDAAINPGNSGGPLLNVRGEVIGINTMIATGGANQSSGIGFAIPINAAKAFIDDIRNFGHVRRPSLGIRSLPIGPELAQELGLPADYGVLIMQVSPGGAADRAGLKGGTQRAYLGNTPILLGGDLVVAMDGEEITDQRDLAAAMNRHRAGDAVTVTIYRGKQRVDVKVTLGEAQGQA